MRCCCIVRKIDIAEFYSGCSSILLKFQALCKEIKFFLWGQWVGDSLDLAAGGRVQPITRNTLCALQQAGGHPNWCCASCRYKTVAAHTNSLSSLTRLLSQFSYLFQILLSFAFLASFWLLNLLPNHQFIWSQLIILCRSTIDTHSTSWEKEVLNIVYME